MSPIHICITKNSVDRAAYPPRENWKVERVYVSRELSKEKKKNNVDIVNYAEQNGKYSSRCFLSHCQSRHISLSCHA